MCFCSEPNCFKGKFTWSNSSYFWININAVYAFTYQCTISLPFCNATLFEVSTKLFLLKTCSLTTYNKFMSEYCCVST